MAVANRFFDHLDICRQCAQHPFDLCPAGQILLAQSVTELAFEKRIYWQRQGIVQDQTVRIEALEEENKKLHLKLLEGSSMPAPDPKRIKESREWLGLNIYQAEKLTGIDHTLIQDIESGDMIPDPVALNKLSRAYSVSPETFFGEGTYRSPELEKEIASDPSMTPGDASELRRFASFLSRVESLWKKPLRSEPKTE